MKKRILVIDDIRTLDIFNAQIDYARTGEDGLKSLRDAQQNMYDELHLDHDLGDAKAMSGYAVLMTASVEELRLPEIVRIISSNPVGMKNMSDCLIHDFGYESIGFTGRSFRRREKEDDQGHRIPS